MSDKALGADAAAVEGAGSSAPEAAIARHTAGPWRVVSDFVGPFRVVNDKGSTIAACGYTNSSEAMANAELIAAAPEMKEALKAMLALPADPLGGVIDRATRQRAREVLAKAEGR